jgi:predicted nuclease of predicted toxin-antitoxin system
VRIKVDEDLPLSVAEVLREAGHDVATVVDQGWSGWTDARIWIAVCTERRMLITADKGLADLRRLREVKTSLGVVLLRVQNESWRSYGRLAEKLVSSLDLHELAGAVTVVTENNVRVRRA